MINLVKNRLYLQFQPAICGDAAGWPPLGTPTTSDLFRLLLIGTALADFAKEAAAGGWGPGGSISQKLWTTHAIYERIVFVVHVNIYMFDAFSCEKKNTH